VIVWRIVWRGGVNDDEATTDEERGRIRKRYNVERVTRLERATICLEGR